MIKALSVFRKSRLPLYLQVARLMRQKIERQEWRMDAQIPTLNELEREYQVSRITLRESLGQLEDPLFRLERFRRASGQAIALAVPEPEAGLAAGILVGLRDLVDRDLAAEWTGAGVDQLHDKMRKFTGIAEKRGMKLIGSICRSSEVSRPV